MRLARDLRRYLRHLYFLLVILLATDTTFSQTLDKLSNTVVFLHDQSRYATGFMVGDDRNNLFLVTAQHAVTGLQPGFGATIRGEKDTPINIPIEDLTGLKDIKWTFHDVADVAVVLIHPNNAVRALLREHFLPTKLISHSDEAPSRSRPLTTLGFPLRLGTEEHFSPISRDSKPASGLLTLPRFDTHRPATFFLLDTASIGGFSGAPVFLMPNPYAEDGTMIIEVSNTPQIVGLVHGTMSDETGGKLAAIVPSRYILETIAKATPAK